MLDSGKLLAGCSLAAAVLALIPAQPAFAGAKGPKITARPRSVMVNTETTLKGRGFPASSTIELRECGRTFWLDPEDPCLEGGKSVMTDSKGKFTTSFSVGLCPEGEPTKKPTQRVCWIGELVSGEDTGQLVGAARLVVSYP
jgi:hypothetical protein